MVGRPVSDGSSRPSFLRAGLSASWKLASGLLAINPGRRDDLPPPFLAVPGPCDLACAWCNFGQAAAIGFGSDSARLRNELQTLHARGHRAVGFGICHTEPTTSPDFAAVVRSARQIGFERVTLSTSGVRLASSEYVRELASAGVTDVILSLPGLDTPMSDLLLARAGAGKDKLRALSNCLSSGLRIDAIVMFLRPALRNLPDAAARIGRIPGWRSRSLLHLSGCLMDPVPAMPPDRHAVLWPRYGEVAWTLRRIQRTRPAFRLYSSEMPVCVRIRMRGVAGESNERKSDAVRFCKPAELCEGCRWSGCLGVHEGYWHRHGAPLLPGSGVMEPANTSLDDLRRQLEVQGKTQVAPAIQEWQGSARACLAPFHDGSARIQGYRLSSAHQEGAVLVTAWESDQDRMEVTIEPSRASRFFVAGRQFALSYRSSTPVDSSRREQLLRGILAALEG